MPFPYGQQYERGPLKLRKSGRESCPLCLSPQKELWSCPIIPQQDRILGHILPILLLTRNSCFFPWEVGCSWTTVQPGWKNCHLGMYRILNEEELNTELTGNFWDVIPSWHYILKVSVYWFLLASFDNLANSSEAWVYPISNNTYSYSL